MKVIHYFDDNWLIFKTKDKMIIEKCDNQLQDYHIKNLDSYSTYITKIIKKNRLLSLINSELTVIVPAIYLESHENNIYNIFDKVGFNKINIVNELTIIKPTKRESIVKINTTNLTYYYKDNNKLKYKHLNYSSFIEKNESNIIKIISEFNKHFKINKTVLFGNYLNLIELAAKIESNIKDKVYVQDNNKIYLINLFNF